jgi:hypothetical protein
MRKKAEVETILKQPGAGVILYQFSIPDIAPQRPPSFVKSTAPSRNSYRSSKDRALH